MPRKIFQYFPKGRSKLHLTFDKSLCFYIDLQIHTYLIYLTYWFTNRYISEENCVANHIYLMDPCNDALGNLGIQVPGDLLQDNLSKSQIGKCNWNWELTSGTLGFGFKTWKILERSSAMWIGKTSSRWYTLKYTLYTFYTWKFFIFSSFGHNHETGTPDIFLVLGFFLHHKERN